MLSSRSTAACAALFLLLSNLSCNEPTASRVPRVPLRADLTTLNSTSLVRISQVYGGGGNSGATLKNDFIELFNPGTQAVELTGWSVQYAAATGTTWQVTRLAHAIQPGRYYLIKEAAGAGGTTDLPTPDTMGSIPMGATRAKCGS